MIRIRKLSKHYSSHKALDHIDLTIEKGNVVGLLGPNGAGKTSLLRIMAGYLPATSGLCEINGHDIHQDPLRAQSQIGYLPETPPLYTEMRAAAYLCFAAKIKGIPRREVKQRVEFALKSVSMTDQKDQIIRTLSKGYRQRLGIAMAIVSDPSVLLLDEPTVALDPGQVLETRQLIKKLAAHRTVIFSSHLLAEVAETCNQIAILSGGRLLIHETRDRLETFFDGLKAVKLILREEVDELIGKLERQFTPERIEASGSHAIVIYKKDLDAIRSEIPGFVVAQGYHLMEYTPFRLPLEKIYHQLAHG